MASQITDMVDLPPPYRILPYSIPFRVPGFIKQTRPEDRVLAPEPCECEAWFATFTDRVLNAVAREFLPVCRMSDGEFFFLFGHQPPSLRLPFAKRLRRRFRQILDTAHCAIYGYRAWTTSSASSGEFTRREWLDYRIILDHDYRTVLKNGILALHLSYGQNTFQEHYFPAVNLWLTDSGYCVTTNNYVPFYFVYGLVRGPAFRELIGGRRLLLVHSAIGDKREAIARSLSIFRPRSIEWLQISPNRSFAEMLDLNSIADAPELCLVGAGIGKPRILRQLEPVKVPCIDAGYAFEVWADPDRQWDRPYMTCDGDMDITKVRFLSPEHRASLGLL